MDSAQAAAQMQGRSLQAALDSARPGAGFNVTLKTLLRIVTKRALRGHSLLGARLSGEPRFESDCRRIGTACLVCVRGAPTWGSPPGAPGACILGRSRGSSGPLSRPQGPPGGTGPGPGIASWGKAASGCPARSPCAGLGLAGPGLPRGRGFRPGAGRPRPAPPPRARIGRQPGRAARGIVGRRTPASASPCRAPR